MSLHKRFPKNEQGRDFIVGDIHGHFSMLEKMLADVSFDESKDRVFSVGDLVDRGPESIRMLEFLEKPWFHAVMGNHEHMLMEYHLGRTPERHYAMNGGTWAILMQRDERAPYAEAVNDMPVAITIGEGDDAIGIVHADCPLDSWTEFTSTMEKSSIDQLDFHHLGITAMWDRGRINNHDQSGVLDVGKVFVGHTPLNGPVALGNVHFIDTGAFRPQGMMTLVDLSRGEPLLFNFLASPFWSEDERIHFDA